MIKNRYEGYTRGEADYTKPQISIYRTKQIYRDDKHVTISKMVLYSASIILVLLISVLIYKLKYEKCKSVCSRI